MLDFRREEGSPNIISRKTHPLDASDDPAAQKDYALWLTKTLGIDRDYFTSEDNLCRLVLREARDHGGITRLAAEISLAEANARRRTEQLQDFSFHEMEIEVSDDLVKNVDSGLGEAERKASEAKRESERLASLLKKEIQTPTSRYKSIRDRFQNIANEFLHVPAVLFVKQNDKGNLDFHVEVKKGDGLDQFSSEADGTTFKKLLCMAFDLAILSEYADSRFYHFIYHDGALEGEDDRKKFALLKLVQRLCDESGIQYIMSAIQHELPRLPADTSFQFHPGEIVRELHDEGDSGRLFRMAIF